MKYTTPFPVVTEPSDVSETPETAENETIVYEAVDLEDYFEVVTEFTADPTTLHVVVRGYEKQVSKEQTEKYIRLYYSVCTNFTNDHVDEHLKRIQRLKEANNDEHIQCSPFIRILSQTVSYKPLIMKRSNEKIGVFFICPDGSMCEKQLKKKKGSF